MDPQEKKAAVLEAARARFALLEAAGREPIISDAPKVLKVTVDLPLIDIANILRGLHREGMIGLREGRFTPDNKIEIAPTQSHLTRRRRR